MKQTAVEWLVNALVKHDRTFREFYEAEIEQAKQLEKQQIVDGVYAGYNYDGARLEEHSEQYYTETYGK